MSSANAKLLQALRRLLVLQLVIALVVATVGYLWHGEAAMRAALFGGGVAAAATLVLWWYGYRAVKAGSNLARNAMLIYGGAIVRFSTVLVLLLVGIAILRLQPLWLFGGLVAGLLTQTVTTALVPETKTCRAKR